MLHRVTEGGGGRGGETFNVDTHAGIFAHGERLRGRVLVCNDFGFGRRGRKKIADLFVGGGLGGVCVREEDLGGGGVCACVVLTFSLKIS